MSTVNLDDADDVVELAWDEEAQLWHGAGAEPWRDRSSAVGQAGPAGVVYTGEGDLQVSECLLSGRVEQVWLPSDPDKAQTDLLEQFLVSKPDLGVRTRTGRGPLRLRFRSPDDRVLLSRWARLNWDCEHTDDTSPAWPFLVAEMAVCTHQLHRYAPDFAGDRMARDSQRAADCAAGLTIPPEAERSAQVDELPHRLGAWAAQLLEALRQEQGAEWKDLVDALERLLSSRYLDKPQFLGGPPASAAAAPLDTWRGLPEKSAFRGIAQHAVPPVGHPNAGERWLAIARDAVGMPAGSEGLVSVVNGAVEIDEITARRLDLGPGPGRIDIAAGGKGCTITLPAQDKSAVVRSRWVVLFGSDSSVVGVGPLVCEGGGDARKARGQVLIDDEPASVAFTTHPVLPDALTGSVSIVRLVDEARRAWEDERIGALDTARTRWEPVALDWLRLGSLYRAAWARSWAGRTLPGDAFTDVAKRDDAEEVLARFISAGVVPAKSASATRAGNLPGWVLIHRAVRPDTENGL